MKTYKDHGCIAGKCISYRVLCLSLAIRIPPFSRSFFSTLPPTMGLDERGDIAIGEIIIYLPILLVSAILVYRHGIKRRAGWIFLVILSLGE